MEEKGKESSPMEPSASGQASEVTVEGAVERADDMETRGEGGEKSAASLSPIWSVS